MKDLNTYAGFHADVNGTFEVFYYPNPDDRRLDVIEDYEAGWYWCVYYYPGGLLAVDNALGPYASSQEAWQAAKDLDFSINHGGRDG